MVDWQARTRMLLGDNGINLLKEKHVIVVGIGGVGAYTAEMLCRYGIGKITIVDSDSVVPSNINRQLLALHSTIGQSKVDLLESRLLDINPEVKVTKIKEYLNGESVAEIFGKCEYDYCVDAIDTLSPKMDLINFCYKNEMKIVSSMGAGGKIDPTKVKLTSLKHTTQCTLAKALRKRLPFGVQNRVRAVYSTELIDKDKIELEEGQNKISVVGTVSWMPAVFGMVVAYQVAIDI